MLIGRTAACELRLDDSRVSSEHASIAWTRGAWELRDLGSRNGTFVDGKRLDPGARHPLTAGARVAFGHEHNLWIFEDAGPPAALAESLVGGEVRVAEDGILALPDGTAPELAVYPDARGRWVVEVGDAPPRPVADGEVIEAAGRAWRVRVPAVVDGTATVETGPTLDGIKLRFAVSRDEEHVQLTVIHRGREIPLDAREHAYTLLTLARARLSEVDEPAGEQGWRDRDQLLKMLGVDANALNVAIYRARGQLTAAGVDGAAGIVEVRRGQRRIGVEPSRLEIVPM